MRTYCHPCLHWQKNLLKVRSEGATECVGCVCNVLLTAREVSTINSFAMDENEEKENFISPSTIGAFRICRPLCRSERIRQMLCLVSKHFMCCIDRREEPLERRETNEAQTLLELLIILPTNIKSDSLTRRSTSQLFSR